MLPFLVGLVFKAPSQCDSLGRDFVVIEFVLSCRCSLPRVLWCVEYVSQGGSRLCHHRFCLGGIEEMQFGMRLLKRVALKKVVLGRNLPRVSRAPGSIDFAWEVLR